MEVNKKKHPQGGESLPTTSNQANAPDNNDYTTPGSFWCPACGTRSAIWSGDYENEDLWLEQSGYTSLFHCSNCESDIYVIHYQPESEADHESD